MFINVVLIYTLSLYMDSGTQYFSYRICILLDQAFIAFVSGFEGLRVFSAQEISLYK